MKKMTHFFKTKPDLVLCVVANIIISGLIVITIFHIKTLLQEKTNLTEEIYTPMVPVVIPNIAEWHILGSTSDKKNLPSANLDLQLLGVVMGSASTESTAIIATNHGEEEHIYKMGDSINHQIMVKEIFSDHVVLDNQGHLENLFFTIPELTLDTSPEGLNFNTDKLLLSQAEEIKQ